MTHCEERRQQDLTPYRKITPSKATPKSTVHSLGASVSTTLIIQESRDSPEETSDTNNPRTKSFEVKPKPRAALTAIGEPQTALKYLQYMKFTSSFEMSRQRHSQSTFFRPLLQTIQGSRGPVSQRTSRHGSRETPRYQRPPREGIIMTTTAGHRPKDTVRMSLFHANYR
ncbi:hypothetical protein BHE90_004343 [Fusarium euwallaceae]|uniref:Uncharacterized protein n=1 Tax=Fusarium euwallaceae TaxID=1147111 RepID=A0A430LZR0_9HYPO|nr:hypothetical protein BHE90_004343 [Fusarium euwallaceae]